MHLVPLLLATALGAAAPDAPLGAAPAAALAPLAVAPPAPAPSATLASPRLKLFGLQLHGGVPDGGVLSLVVRPVKWVRADAGFAYNYLGTGVQGGVTLVPFHWAVVPTLRLEGGRFFKTDVSGKLSGTFPDAFDPALRKFGYDFWSAQAGLEFGSQRTFVFFLRGGVAWVRSGLADVRGYQPDGGSTTVDVESPKLSATIPTVNLGFIFYVW